MMQTSHCITRIHNFEFNRERELNSNISHLPDTPRVRGQYEQNTRSEFPDKQYTRWRHGEAG
jgi:hypothetical protein